jgi:hypothetical protein
MSVMDLDFYGLARPVQERFIASTRAQAVPTPLAVQPAALTHMRPWLVGSAAALLVLIGLTALGFGDLNSEFALASTTLLAGYVALFALSVGCLLRALALRHRFLSLPFTPGSYLFPIGVVVARSAQVKLHPLSDLDGSQLSGKTVRLTFRGGQSFEFTTRDEDTAGQVQKLVSEAKKTLQLAEETSNWRELARLDPLRDNGFSNPFGPTAGYRMRSPAWARGWLALALILGLGGGYGLWKVRNTLGEKRLYQAAAARNDVEGFQAYLARGGNRDEVRQVLLPRAELKRAEAVGTVEAIEAYIDSHPSSRIADEVAASLRSALLSALESAKGAGTLSAIRELRTRYKNVAPIADEIAAAEHQYYERVFEQYSSEAPKGEKIDPVPFIKRLLDYLERHGPTVEVRWRRQLKESTRLADTQVKLSAYFMGNHSIPSQYFDAAHSRQREAKASEKLLSLLQPHFPSEVLHFELAEAFDAPDAKPSNETPPLPSPSVPTVFITHNVEMTGGYMNANPRGIFVGAGLLFEAEFVIPGDAQALSFRYSVWRPPDLQLLKQEGMDTEGVYEAMVGPTFENFAERYAASIVKLD